MGQPDGFKKYKSELPTARAVSDRVNDYREIYPPPEDKKVGKQAARCMDCGVPFCHNGCPLGNLIPDFNHAVYKGEWQEAFQILNNTNNFPEFTGRICPAPCEASCVLSINNEPVTIEYIEKSIVEIAFEKGYIKPKIPQSRTEKQVAIVGSGPTGLAAAAQLNKAGHWVTVFEKSDRIGGLLRYGIPDFKLEKNILDRRLQLMKEEGITFKPESHVGINVTGQYLKDAFDAIVVCGGASAPRDLNIPGRGLKGVHFAMDFLTQQNRRVAGDADIVESIWATDKNVVVIGGGDTGSDCVGTSNRHKANSILQIELLGKPPLRRNKEENPWPAWPFVLTTSSSHEEGAQRAWAMLTKEFIGDEEGQLRGIKLVDLEWQNAVKGGKAFREVPNSERIVPCELALLAIGFTGAEKGAMIDELKLTLDQKGNIQANNYMTEQPGIFAAGDIRRGQSLVVWAISEGREAARAVDEWLMGTSNLECKDVPESTILK